MPVRTSPEAVAGGSQVAQKGREAVMALYRRRAGSVWLSFDHWPIPVSEQGNPPLPEIPFAGPRHLGMFEGARSVAPAWAVWHRFSMSTNASGVPLLGCGWGALIPTDWCSSSGAG